MKAKRGKEEKQFNQSIGLLVRKLRKKAAFNQTDTAHAIGLDQSAFSRIESGNQSMTAAQWFMFCEFIGASPNLLSQVRKLK